MVHVETPDPSVNFLANGWLLYQVLAWRDLGAQRVLPIRRRVRLPRSASGRDGAGPCGAGGPARADPALRRRQFREGDVQHWWHPPLGRGVRTRISDDFLWLPYATCRYVAAIGDTGVLDEKIQLSGRDGSVQPEEDSYYDLPTRSEESATLYDHCVRAIKHGLRFGEHGLPLMGCGDWNDGMNLVGERRQGRKRLACVLPLRRADAVCGAGQTAAG